MVVPETQVLVHAAAGVRAWIRACPDRRRALPSGLACRGACGRGGRLGVLVPLALMDALAVLGRGVQPGRAGTVVGPLWSCSGGLRSCLASGSVLVPVEASSGCDAG